MYSGSKQSYLLPYGNNPGFFGKQPLLMPTLTISAFGQTLQPQIDTGSRGLRITQNLLPPGLQFQGTPGSIFYWSSGLRLNGIWTMTQVTFPGAVSTGGAPMPAVATVPVLIETSMTCEAGTWPNACSPASVTTPTTGPNDPKDVFMGIGFDRTGFGDVPEDNQNNQNYNPLLNFDAMRSGTMVSGYILTPNGVQIGLTNANTAQFGVGLSQFAYAQLVPTGLAQVPGSPPDWQTAMGNVAINGTGFGLGEGVIDTGIGNYLLTLPGRPTSGTLNSGVLTTNLLALPGLAGYTFDAANPPTSNDLAPSSVSWSPLQTGRFSQSSSTTFLNTGRNPLNAFNVLYDATNGYLGLQTNNPFSGSTAFLWPAISAIGNMSFPGGFATNLPLILRGDTTISTPGTATFSGQVVGSGNLTVSGGGTVKFTLGAYTGGNVSVTPGTKLDVSNVRPAITSIAVPTVNYDATVTPSGDKNAVYASFSGGPPCLTELDTGSDALVVEESFKGSINVTSTPLTSTYAHCTNPRPGFLGYGTVSLLDKNNQPLLTTIPNIPILVVKDGVVSQNNSPNHAILGLRMNGANGSTGGGGLLPSAKLMFPTPYNQMFVLDRPNNTIYFGSFPTADFGTIQLTSMDCNATLPANAVALPCWDDGAIPVDYTFSETPANVQNPQNTASLFDSGAASSIQFQTGGPPSWMLTFKSGGSDFLVNNVNATLRTSFGSLPIPLTSTIEVASNTNCNGNIINAGNNLFNNYQVLFDQVHGYIGLRPSALSLSPP